MGWVQHSIAEVRSIHKLIIDISKCKDFWVKSKWKSLTLMKVNALAVNDPVVAHAFDFSNTKMYKYTHAVHLHTL